MRRLIAAFILVLSGAWLVAGGQSDPSGESQPGRVLVMDLEGVIGPASARFISQALAEAEARDSQVLVVRMDTPGGLSLSMREIIRDILASDVPVVTYVAPSGSRAASAGAYILYASHVAAMAPGTNVGAATPVQIGGMPGTPQPGSPPGETPVEGSEPGGEEADGGSGAAPGDASKAKAVNDAVAYIRSLAEMRGRNVEWAERAVREAASLPASEALEIGVIDHMAGTLDELLVEIDGRSVETAAGSVTLATAGARVERIEPGTLTRLLGVLSNPNVAFLLMLIGVYGIIFEFMNPGTIGPGVIGAISLVIGLYALNQLPLSYAGIALILLGLGFMVGEALSPSIGILGLGGVVAFIVGAAFLIDTDVPQYQLSWWTIAATGALTGGFFLWLLAELVRSRSHPLAAGRERMLSEPATILDWSGGHGHVQAQGERWKARGEGAFDPGERVRILRIDGLELVIGPSK